MGDFLFHEKDGGATAFLPARKDENVIFTQNHFLKVPFS
jgi:hypothetical protein